MTDSTRDFADFIRSTGPSKAQDVAPVINPANRSTTSLHSLRSAHITGSSSRNSSPGGERTKSLTKSTMENENIPPVPPMPSKGKGAMQPRTANAAINGNSELIDFLRSGPEQNGQHRISRSVAPFRSTMDSDQLKDLGDRLNGDAPLDLRLNTNVGPAQSQPSASSTRPGRTTSRSGVPNSNAGAAVHPAHSGQPQSLSTSMVHPAHSGEPQSLSALPATSRNSLAPSGEPMRKRHRNKDPYAIDTDEEDDDLLTALPKGKRQEESLMDFLNSMEPPKDNAPRPITNGTTARTSSLVNRGRTNSINSQRSPTTDSAGRTKSLQNTGGPRAGYTPSVRPQQSNSSMRPIGTPTGSKPRMEARSPGEGTKDRESAQAFKSSTRDLADFLKNSAPEDQNSAPAPIVGRKGKLPPKEMEKERQKVDSKPKRGSFFSRGGRKKTWLDMP